MMTMLGIVMKASSTMNAKSQNDWTPRPMRFAQWSVSLALLCATVSPSPSFSQGTLPQRLACTPDVYRLCSAFIPNVDEITICLRERTAELSDACRTALEAGMNHLPAVGNSTAVRNRDAR